MMSAAPATTTGLVLPAQRPGLALSDTAEWFARLDDVERRLVGARQRAMRLIASSKNIHAGALIAERTFIGLRGFSSKNLSKLFRAWVAAGCDDRLLVDSARYPWIVALIEGRDQPASKTALAPAFIEYVGGLYMQNHRSMDAAWRDLVRDWQASWHTDAKLPGIMPKGEPGSARDYWRQRDPRTLTADTCPPDLPPGWTKGNLRTVVQQWCAITPAEVALARRGTAAMRHELPTIRTSRAGIEYGMHLYTDDLEHDFEVAVPEFADAPLQRPLEVGILDLASAVYGPFVTQPTMPMDDGTKRKLGWECVKWVFGAWLEQNGIPRDWPIYLHVERGTATVDPEEARLWHQMTNGLVNICYTEMKGSYCLAWDEKRVGNSNGKACLESSWALHHNYAAALPGYVGRNRDNAPAIIKGQRAETIALLQFAATLPPEDRARVKLPVLTYDEFVRERMDMIARINGRADHQLEAFEKIVTWRPRGIDGAPWRPLAELEQVPAGVRGPEFLEYNTRLETPIERRARLRARGNWDPCPPHWLALIYGFRATPLTVNKGTIHLRRGTSHWWFMAESHAAQVAAGIKNGHEYLVAYNPHSMNACYILDPKGKKYLGCWQQRGHRKGERDQLAKSIAHRIGLQQEVQDKVERLLIASGQLVDTEIRRDYNRALGAPATGRIELLSADHDSQSIGGAASASPATSEPANALGGEQARSLLNDAENSPASSAPHQPAEPSLGSASQAGPVVPALTTEPRALTGAAPAPSAAPPSVASQIAADAVRAKRASDAKPRRQAAARSLYRDALKNL